ncbi:MAG: RNA-binding S4 domain-containing protein [Lysobacterales bacterium]
MGEDSALTDVRLDIYLWATRMFKTRALAKLAIEASRVRVAGSVAKPSRPVRMGDPLEVERGEERFELEVLALSTRRGSAPEAQKLYRELPESIERRAAEAARRRAERGGFTAPATKPDKRARRLIRALGDIELM